MTRDEVLDAIYDEVTKHDTCIKDSVVSLLEEILRLREKLAASEDDEITAMADAAYERAKARFTHPTTPTRGSTPRTGDMS